MRHTSGVITRTLPVRTRYYVERMRTILTREPNGSHGSRTVWVRMSDAEFATVSAAHDAMASWLRQLRTPCDGIRVVSHNITTKR